MKKPRKPYKLKKRNDRGGQYAIVDKATGKCVFTGTADRDEADDLARVKYKLTDHEGVAHHQMAAEYHLAHCNDEWTVNTWDMIAKRMINAPRRGRKSGAKRMSTIATLTANWNNAIWNELRHKRAIDTVPNDFLEAIKGVGAGLANFGRMLHNYALGHKLMPFPIMGDMMWPRIGHKPMSRTVTEIDHLKLVEQASNLNQRSYTLYVRNNPDTTREEWRDDWVNWLWFLWFTGASSADAANMKAENIKWGEGVLEYQRGKWQKPEEHAPVRVAIQRDGQFEKLLKSLPRIGNLFPMLSRSITSNRASAMGRFAEGAGIPHLTPHGYRFAFAERARKGGMSAEDRMANLGHANYDQTHHYDKNAKVVPQSIEVLDGGLEAA
jgi:hypothetical protein